MPGQVVADSEDVFRRVQDEHVTAGQISRQAFRPNNHDTTGLSVYRAMHCSAEGLATSGRVGRTYWVARLNVGRLRQLGLDVVCDAESGGHAIIPQMHSGVRRTVAVEQFTVQIVESCIVQLEGPWEGTVPR